MLAIIKGSSLWLSGAHNMNDHMEDRWSERSFHAGIQAYKTYMKPEVWDRMLGVYEFVRPRSFIFCLSSAPDVLSQWRAYGADGTGVTLGFDPNALTLNRHRPVTTAREEFATTLCDVLYDAKMQDEVMKDLFSRHLGDPTKIGEADETELMNKMNHFASTLAYFKNPAFSEEKEWRLIHSPLFKQNANGAMIKLGSNLDQGQRLSGGMLQTHFILPLQPPFLKEIWLGPKSKVTDFDLAVFMEQQKLSGVRVHRSSASYR